MLGRYVGLVLLIAGLAGCGHSADPRAYPGSFRGASLEDALQKYAVALPPCSPTDVHFYETDDLRGTLFLTYAVPSSCVADALMGVGFRDLTAVVFHANPFGSYEQSTFGWTFASDGQAKYYRGIVADRQVSVAVEPSDTDSRMYIEVIAP